MGASCAVRDMRGPPSGIGALMCMLYSWSCLVAEGTVDAAMTTERQYDSERQVTELDFEKPDVWNADAQIGGRYAMCIPHGPRGGYISMALGTSHAGAGVGAGLRSDVRH